ncbi:hypothetical protein FB451DRAFT_1180645 [Mycena latifolia]|nr:hypothetical protein FB451DRAFT_1180645 [Mycena latifolia]
MNSQGELRCKWNKKRSCHETWTAGLVCKLHFTSSSSPLSGGTAQERRLKFENHIFNAVRPLSSLLFLYSILIRPPAYQSGGEERQTATVTDCRSPGFCSELVPPNLGLAVVNRVLGDGAAGTVQHSSDIGDTGFSQLPLSRGHRVQFRRTMWFAYQIPSFSKWWDDRMMNLLPLASPALRHPPMVPIHWPGTCNISEAPALIPESPLVAPVQ